MTTHRERYAVAAALACLNLPLPKLLQIFGSDKQQVGKHSYGMTYDSLFRSKRYRRIKLLEIGLLNGESLLAWRSYFPFGMLIGIDIEDKSCFQAPRIRVHQADQGSPDSITAVCKTEGPFDIIVDDGSHLNRHQIITFHAAFESLKEDGIYVIEDVQTSFWWKRMNDIDWDGRHIDDPQFHATCFGTFLELAKYLNHAEFMSQRSVDPIFLDIAKQIKNIIFEHNLIIVVKGRNVEPSNVIGRGAAIG